MKALIYMWSKSADATLVRKLQQWIQTISLMTVQTRSQHIFGLALTIVLNRFSQYFDNTQSTEPLLERYCFRKLSTVLCEML